MQQALHKLKLPDWVVSNFTWKQAKPVIRSAVAAWLAILLLVIYPIENELGQASFFVLIVAFLTPPSDPYTITMWRSFYYLLLVLLSWALAVIASAIASATRNDARTATALKRYTSSSYECQVSPQACQSNAVFEGVFIETGASVVFAVILGLGTFLFIWLKTHYLALTFGTVYAMICLIVQCSYGPLFPYFYPNIGLLFVLPMLIQMAINVLCSILILPESVNNKYLHSLIAMLSNIRLVIVKQSDQLAAPIEDWEDFEYISAHKVTAQNVLQGLAPIDHYLDREISYGRLSGTDLRHIKNVIAQLLPRIAGFWFFRELVMSNGNRRLDKIDTKPPKSGSMRDSVSAPPSGFATPASTPPQSRPQSIHRKSAHGDVDGQGETASSSMISLPSLADAESKKRHHSLFIDALHKHYKPVGVLETEFYMNLEANDKVWEREHARVVVQKLYEAVQELVTACGDALQTVLVWLDAISRDRLFNAITGHRVMCPSKDIESTLTRLQTTLHEFRTTKRLTILEPYQTTFHTSQQPPHKCLFRAFLFEFHIAESCDGVCDLLTRVQLLDRKRAYRRWWYPSFKQLRERLFAQMRSTPGEHDNEDEPADEISGMPDYSADVGVRDPDALPPRNVAHLIGGALHSAFSFIGRGDVFFCLKAALLVVLIDLPSFFRTSASFMYFNRGIWAVIMATLTLAQHTGDTVFGFLVRLVGTFLGALLGMLLWYISSGNGYGNPYALCAVMAVALPLIQFVRIYYIWVSPMPAAFFVVSIALVVGYSWQDSHPLASTVVNVGIGWDVAWRRFVTVAIGVTAAFIFNFIPAPHTARSNVRAVFAKTIMTLGDLHCGLSNYARKRRRQETRNEELDASIVAVRAKLRGTESRMRVIKFEQIQGPWPSDAYHQLLTVQLEVLELMSALNALLSRLDPKWINPFLERMGWTDRHYVADQLAVLYMTSTALKTGSPLPFLSPAPLIDRFQKRARHYGFRVVLNEEEGLPNELTLDTLGQIDYLHFAVGTTLTFSILYRLDKIMFLTKSIVGECFQIRKWPRQGTDEEALISGNAGAP